MRLDNYTVPRHELNVRGGLRIETESLAGKTSSTDRTSNGVKAQTFNVSLVIKYSESDLLTQLIRIAEATDSNGRMKIYTVVDTTVNVASMRQVQFTDSFSWREDTDLRAWRVSFMLIEYKSVPEKTETRQKKKKTAAPASVTGTTTAMATTSTESTTGEQEEPATKFEKFLSRIDKAIG